MDPKSHWDKVYRTRRPNEVSWYRPHLDVSLQLIEEAAPNRDAQIIDVGGGESTLVDDLLATGGTMVAGCQLVEKAGGLVMGCVFLVELAFLGGRDKLKKYEVFSLIRY